MKTIILIGMCILTLIIISGCEDENQMFIGEEDIFVCRVSYCNTRNETFHSMEISWTTREHFCVCVSDDGLERKYKYERPPQLQDFFDKAREEMR